MASHKKDLALTAAVLRGEEGAAEKLFEQVFDGLYRHVCARLGGDHHTAQDIVSETLLSGLRALGTFRGDGSLISWFFRIALRKISDLRRRHAITLVAGTNGELETLLGPACTRAPSALDILICEETRRLVREALESLPTHHKAVLKWKYMEESSVGDVAQRLKVSQKAAERRLARARVALATALKRRHIHG